MSKHYLDLSQIELDAGNMLKQKFYTIESSSDSEIYVSFMKLGAAMGWCRKPKTEESIVPKCVRRS